MEPIEIDLEIPEAIKRNMDARKKEICDWEESEKLRKKFPALKNRLEALRESRPTQETSIKDQRALQHFEVLKKQQDDQLAQIEANLKRAEDQYSKNLQLLEINFERSKTLLEKNLETIKVQCQQGRDRVLQKGLYVEDKLQKARERVETHNKVKTKEEILLEKQMVDLLVNYMELQPNENLNTSFPDYKELNLPLPSISVLKKSDPPPPKLPPPPPPQISKEPVETPDPTPQRFYQTIAPQPVYPTVITNTKTKRVAKQVSSGVL